MLRHVGAATIRPILVIIIIVVVVILVVVKDRWRRSDALEVLCLPSIPGALLLAALRRCE
jgi:hypothetical protein